MFPSNFVEVMEAGETDKQSSNFASFYFELFCLDYALRMAEAYECR